MKNKILKTEEEKKTDEDKKRNYNRYYYHLVRKTKNKNLSIIKIIGLKMVKIEVGKFEITF